MPPCVASIGVLSCTGTRGHRRAWPGACVAAMIAAVLSCGDTPSVPSAPHDPAAAQMVTEDIARFWTAFDRITGVTDTLPLRVQYLDAGTVGLRDFTAARWKNARTLTQMVWPLREYYRSIRGNTLRLAALEPEIRAIYRRLQNLYPPAVFPDVYFAIGGMGTGGTTSPSGLLIGVELFSHVAGAPVESLTPWQLSVIHGAEVLPAIVAHELVHYQQHHGGSGTLLAHAIREGSADFVSELLTEITINEHLVEYGTAHETELWHEFAMAMHGTDVSGWLYNGGSVTGPESRPADLGYFIGMRIAQAYYDRIADKSQALRDILNVRDFPAFLAASGYPEHLAAAPARAERARRLRRAASAATR